MLAHFVLGCRCRCPSYLGLVALSGVAINDALVLVVYINRLLAQSKNRRQAIVDGASRRFRPVILTTLTTFFGLLPIMFEKSVQAQFIIPCAVSLGFGILLVTFVTKHAGAVYVGQLLVILLSYCIVDGYC